MVAVVDAAAPGSFVRVDIRPEELPEFFPYVCPTCRRTRLRSKAPLEICENGLVG
jgi:hypothetical protein